MIGNNREKNKIFMYAVPVVIVLLAFPLIKWVTRSSPGDAGMITNQRSGFDQWAQQGKKAAKPPVTASDAAVAAGGQRSKTQRNMTERTAAQAAAVQGAARQQSGAQAADSSASANDGISTGQRAHEQKFLREHGTEISKYQGYLASLGKKYTNQEVAKMNAEFAANGRVMALKEQYQKDKNPYRWARGMIALPEVRNALVHYSANPKVLGSMSKVTLEALKNPPSPALYRETVRFLSKDSQMSTYMKELTGSLGETIPKTLPKALPGGTDTTPLENLGQQITGGNSAPSIPGMPDIPELPGGSGTSTDDRYPVACECVSGAKVFRQKLTDAIVALGSSKDQSILMPDEGCGPPFRVVAGKENEYARAIIGILSQWGYAGWQLPWAGDIIAIRKTAEFHEEYDFLTSKNCARTFGADTCRPAGFRTAADLPR